MTQEWSLSKFDYIVCKLLFELDCVSTKEKIGDCLGLNVYDNPENFQYKDEAECKILDNELNLLKKYGLIEFGYDTIFLTSEGVNSVYTRKRLEEKTKEVKLYFDTIGNSGSALKLFKSEPGKVVDSELPKEFSDKTFIKDILLIQYPEYKRNDLGITINDLQNKSLTLKQISVEFDILYDFHLKQFKLNCISENSDLFNEIIGKDESFRNSILASFFNEQKESVIYKPSYQEKFEYYLSKNIDKNIFIDKMIIGSRNNFANNILKALNNIPPLICFYIEEMTEDFNNNMSSLCNKAPNSLICVEYVKGDDKFNDYSFKNLIYKKVEFLSCDSLCVCSNDFSFKEELSVVSYNNIDYQMPVVVSALEKKYIISKLAKDFTSGIKLIINQCNEIFNNGDKSNVHNTFDKIYRQYNLVKSLQVLYGESLKEAKLKQSIIELDNDIHIFIDKMIEIMEKSPTTKSKDVLYFENICHLYAKDYLPRIKNLKEKKFKDNPILVKPNAWILDTNVCLENLELLDKFKTVVDVVFIIRKVKEEIDRISHYEDSVGEKAKKVLNKINKLIIIMPNLFQILDLDREDLYKLRAGLDKNKTDNQILAAAMKLRANEKFNSSTIITNDNNLTADALTLDLKVCSLEKFLSDKEY